jgi:hypothetical protein
MLNDLIRRLEAAKEPSYGLNADIWELIGFTPQQEEHCRNWCRQNGRDDLTREDYLAAWANPFTSSIDAAMTLLGPPGYPLWTITMQAVSHGQHGMAYFAEVTVPSSAFQGQSSASFALAVCAAALRARLPRRLGQ